MQYLLFIEINGEFFKKVELTQSFYLIGRVSTCDIQIPNKHVSKIHAYLVRNGDDFYINDGSPPPNMQASTAGTCLLVRKPNGEEFWSKRTGIQLKNGDRVSLGPVILRYIAIESSDCPPGVDCNGTLT